MASAIGAETKGHSVKTFRKATGVRPDNCAMTFSARPIHTSISSSVRIAVRIALFIPSNQRAKRSGGKPETRSPPAPAIASGAKMAPLPSLVAILDAVTAASIWSPWRPRPAKLHRCRVALNSEIRRVGTVQNVGVMPL